MADNSDSAQADSPAAAESSAAASPAYRCWHCPILTRAGRAVRTSLRAIVSQNPRLLIQLDQVLADPILSGVYHVQWEERDFVSIAQAFEQEWRGRLWIA